MSDVDIEPSLRKEFEDFLVTSTFKMDEIITQEEIPVELRPSVVLGEYIRQRDELSAIIDKAHSQLTPEQLIKASTAWAWRMHDMLYSLDEDIERIGKEVNGENNG